MKRLLFLILVAASLWSGYWLFGASGTKTAFEAWFQERRAAGWAADYASLEVNGFPNRFDTTFTDIALADPATGWAWDAPFFQLLTLSYKPDHLIAIWPEHQRISTPLTQYEITQGQMQASIVIRPDTALTLERVRLVADTVRINGSDGAATSMSTLHLAGERLDIEGQGSAAAAQMPARYRLAITAEDLAPDSALRRRIDPNDRLPRTLSALRADVTLGFSQPWDRAAIEQARPQPRSISLRLAEARWGDLELLAAGDLEIDSQGQPTGRITVKARNWREILQMARDSGSLSKSLADALEQGLSMLSGLSGNPRTLDVPLDFRRGKIWLGPVPVLDSPVLMLR